MIQIFYELKSLNFEKLMAIYLEGNAENGQERYPDEAPNMQIQRAEDDFWEYLREDFFCVPDAYYAVLVEEEKYLSALRMEPYGDGWLLEALETAPGCRRMGYAKKLIGELLDTLPAGIRIYSHVSKGNMASLKTHWACGFRVHLEHATYLDGTVTNRSYTLMIETGKHS